MTSLELYDLYYNAYVNNSKSSKIEFIDKLKTFDFSIFRLFSDNLVKKWDLNIQDVDCKELTSGGSTTGIENKYRFGPFEAIVDVEILQKSDNSQVLWLSGTSRDRPHIVYDDRFTFQFKYDGSNLNELFYFVNSFHARTGRKITLCSLSHNYLYLTSHPRFIDWLLGNNKISCLVTTDMEPIFKKSYLCANNIYINDCMIDWQNGLNFHTCRFGKKHILPLFVIDNNKIINWLNLANKTIYNTIDSYKISNLKPQKCKCGSFSLGFEVITRGQKYFPFRRDIGELVRSHYINLQFIRSNNELSIFYRTEGPFLDCDRDFFADIFKEYSIKYHKDKLGMTGLKWPPFWDTSMGPVRIVDFTY